MTVINSIRKLILSSIFSTLFFSSFHIFAQTKTIKFCGDEKDSWPWLMHNSLGITKYYIDYLEPKFNIKIKVEQMPWLRCLNELKKGTYDAVLYASYKTDRLVYGVYPTNPDGTQDPTRSTHNSSYYLYYLKKNTSIKWDGKTLSGLKKPVMITLGFSIKKMLTEDLYVQVLEKNIPVSMQLEKLYNGEVDAIAGQETSVDHVIKTDIPYKNDIIKHPIYLETKPYYIIFSHQIMKNDPELVHGIWDELKNLRNSKEFQLKIEQYIEAHP